MATYVLVHGAWIGGWCWKEIARALRRAGHEVYAPTLTGLGERSHLLRAGIDLDTHIRDIVNVITFEDLSEIILVGHSYGGMVVTGVADAVPERIAALVYLDAFVPENGQALDSLVGANRHTEGDEIARAPLPARVFGVAPERASWLDARTTPHPSACFSQPIKLGVGTGRIRRRVYIYANDPQPTTFTRFYEKLRHDPDWEMHTLPCTHLVQLDMPEELTRILLSASR